MRTTNHAFVNQLLIYTLFTICFSGTIGLGTVWLRHQISLTANASRVLESRLAELDRHLAETGAAIETAQDPALLKQRNLQLALGLRPPVLGQVTNVTDDPGMYLAAKRNRGLYGDSAMSVHLPSGDAAASPQENVSAVPVPLPFKVRLASKN